MGAAERIDVPAAALRRRKPPVTTTRLPHDRRGRVQISRTESMTRLGKGEIRRDAALYPPSINAAHPRPRTWGECQSRGLGLPGSPCPFVGCAMHLYLDVNPDNGSIRYAWGDAEPWEIPETCALRVAARGAHNMARLGKMLGLTREMVRKLLGRAVQTLRQHLPSDAATWTAADRHDRDADLPDLSGLEGVYAVFDRRIPGRSWRTSDRTALPRRAR